MENNIDNNNEQQQSLFRLPTANQIQQEYINIIKRDTNRNHFRVLYDPNENLYDLSKYRGNKSNDNLREITEEFYLKPVFLCAPDELLEGTCKLKCNHCSTILRNDGWADNGGRYIHGLKSGYYLVQRRYLKFRELSLLLSIKESFYID